MIRCALGSVIAALILSGAAQAASPPGAVEWVMVSRSIPDTLATHLTLWRSAARGKPDFYVATIGTGGKEYWSDSDYCPGLGAAAARLGRTQNMGAGREYTGVYDLKIEFTTDRLRPEAFRKVAAYRPGALSKLLDDVLRDLKPCWRPGKDPELKLPEPVANPSPPKSWGGVSSGSGAGSVNIGLARAGSRWIASWRAFHVNGAEFFRWTDSDACPELELLAQGMERARTWRFPPARRGEFGTYYAVDLQGSGGVNQRIEDNQTDGRMRRIFEPLIDSLEACWRPGRPPPDRRW